MNKVSAGNEILKAILVGSRPPQNDSVWDSARRFGFDVTVHDRNSQGKEKSVDTEIVAQGTEIICTQSEPEILKLHSGDSDLKNRPNWDTEIGPNCTTCA